MSNENEISFLVTKFGRWFQIFGDSIDPEIESQSYKLLAKMALNNSEIVEAYGKGLLVFDDIISSSQKEEIESILNVVVVEEQLAYLANTEEY